MHIAISFKACLLLSILLLFSINNSLANNFASVIKSVYIDNKDNNNSLVANIDYPLSEKAKEALQNGVPLFWNVYIKIHRPRNILWQKTLLETTLHYRLQYHALLNIYRVINENSGAINNFSTLSAALDLMSNFRDARLLNQIDFDKEKQLVIEFKVEFDRNALPIPLRPIAFLNQQWYLSSDWTAWLWKK